MAFYFREIYNNVSFISIYNAPHSNFGLIDLLQLVISQTTETSFCLQNFLTGLSALHLLSNGKNLN